MKSSTYCFHMKTKILADFQVCISVPLRILVWYIRLQCQVLTCRWYGKRTNLKTGVSKKQSTPSFPKNEHFLPPYQGVRNARFSENLACFVILKHPCWDSSFWLISDDFSHDLNKFWWKYFSILFSYLSVIVMSATTYTNNSWLNILENVEILICEARRFLFMMVKHNPHN